jgi:DNA-binding transcriptional LysR family regulator
MGRSFDPLGALVFVKVVEAGSFRGAAAALGIPKSSVSRKVAELEARLGARLLQRTTRRIGLTAAGAAYHRQAARAAQALQDAERAVAELEAEPRGVLRLSASLNFGLLFLPEIVRGYLEAFPQAHVAVNLTDRHVDLVEEELDLAIRAGPLPDSSLVSHRLGGTQLALFASPAYLQRRGRPTSPGQLADHDCLVHGLSGSATWSFHGARRPVQVQVQGRLAADNYLLLRDAAAAGLGIARIPAFLAMEPGRQGALEEVLADLAPAENPIYAVYPSGRHVPQKVRAFVKLLKERFASPPWSRASADTRPAE